MASNDRQVPRAPVTLAGRVETFLMAMLLLGIVGLAALQIVLRNLFSYSLFWADDVIRIAVLWLAVVGAVAASRDGRHIAIAIVPRYCPESWQRPARIAAMAFATLVSAVLAWHMLRFVLDTRAFGDTVLNGLPAWPFQAVMPVGFALMSYRFLLSTIDALGFGRR